MAQGGLEMAILRVDTEVMAASAGKIANTIEEMSGLLNLLNGDVNAKSSACFNIGSGS